MKLKSIRMALFTVVALSISVISCTTDEPGSSTESENSTTPSNPSDPGTSESLGNTLESALIGTWINEYIDSYNNEKYEISFAADHSGKLVKQRNGNASTQTFRWEFNEKNKIVSMYYEGETERVQLLAASPKYAVIASGDEETLYVRKGTTTSNYTVVDSSYPLLGSWTGYQDENEGIKMELTINADGSALMNIFNLSGRLLASDEAVWTLGNTEGTIDTYLVDASDYEVDAEPYNVLISTTSSMVINRTGHYDVYSFLKNGSEKSITSAMLLGLWQADYHWSDSREMWNYDLITMNNGGTGFYKENAPTSNPDEFSFTWKFDAAKQVLAITYPNGEYGYKENEPEFETMTIKIIMGNEDICFCLDEDNNLVTIVRIPETRATTL